MNRWYCEYCERFVSDENELVSWENPFRFDDSYLVCKDCVITLDKITEIKDSIQQCYEQSFSLENIRDSEQYFLALYENIEEMFGFCSFCGNANEIVDIYEFDDPIFINCCELDYIIKFGICRECSQKLRYYEEKYELTEIIYHLAKKCPKCSCSIEYEIRSASKNEAWLDKEISMMIECLNEKWEILERIPNSDLYYISEEKTDREILWKAVLGSRFTCYNPFGGSYKEAYVIRSKRDLLIGKKQGNSFYELILTRVSENLFFYEPFCYEAFTFSNSYTTKELTKTIFKEDDFKAVETKLDIKIIPFEEVSTYFEGIIKFSGSIYLDCLGTVSNHIEIKKDKSYERVLIRDLEIYVFKHVPSKTLLENTLTCLEKDIKKLTNHVYVQKSKFNEFCKTNPEFRITIYEEANSNTYNNFVSQKERELFEFALPEHWYMDDCFDNERETRIEIFYMFDFAEFFLNYDYRNERYYLFIKLYQYNQSLFYKIAKKWDYQTEFELCRKICEYRERLDKFAVQLMILFKKYEFLSLCKAKDLILVLANPKNEFTEKIKREGMFVKTLNNIESKLIQYICEKGLTDPDFPNVVSLLSEIKNKEQIREIVKFAIKKIQIEEKVFRLNLYFKMDNSLYRLGSEEEVEIVLNNLSLIFENFQVELHEKVKTEEENEFEEYEELLYSSR